MPVGEHPVQLLEVARSRPRGLLGVGALVDVPVLLQPEVPGGAAHELPHPSRAGPRERGRFERALDQRHVGQVEGHALGAEHALDHRQVLAAALESPGQEVAEAALEQFHVVQHAVVQRNGNVVGRLGEVQLDGLLDGAARRRGRRKRRHLQQLVDRRRFRRLLGESVALLERQRFVSRDAIDEPIEVRPELRIDPGALRCIEQEIE